MQILIVGYRISLEILVRYRNARHIFSASVRYRAVRQELSPISLVTDIGLSAHLWLHLYIPRQFVSECDPYMYLQPYEAHYLTQ
jgi:hypothetical protein